ncbi:MarR family winged helix-turn-helix transcriptional regulator [Brevundimonas sp.]|uniref:MarR family winged helix-turn-helix transcriptional regulator n=1 Tax=Brevundimonas sp. TaxID=1871086 RepID=UPI0025C4B1E5|nr:MarR family winged helix-turn-helix transcriptional regulator [Brevundimonas sp.]
MIASDNALIGTTSHRVAQHIQHRIDDESRETGQTRLSWMAVSHVDEFRASRSATPRRDWKSAVRQPRNLWTAWRGGWVERSPSPNRRRSQIVVPTRKTQKIMRELDPRRAALKEYILETV